MSESSDFPKLKVIYLKERFLKNYLTDLLKIPYTNIVKALLSPLGAYLIFDLLQGGGGLNRERGGA